MKHLLSLRGSIAARLAVGYGLLVAASVAALSAIFYIGTVGVFERSIDTKVLAIANRLVDTWRVEGRPGVERQIELQLNDRIDTDTEIVGLVDAAGRLVMGNLPRWQRDLPEPGQLAIAAMVRGREPVSARLVTYQLDDGVRLVVGRDLSELDGIRSVIERALAISGAVSLLLAFAGALLFRRTLEARIGDIRRTAGHIAAGELSSRIAVQGNDEFAHLGTDINRMLDRIEALMEGVRHVSNSIAHDLRTPLSRVRGRLERALQAASDPQALALDARLAIEDIDSVIGLFDKLLQIAAAEAGVRTRSFEKLDLAAIARDMAELYEAAAEERGVQLRVLDDGLPGAGVYVRGDRHLLANALASVIDNAIKYAGPGVYVDIGAHLEPDPERAGTMRAVATVRDYGPGVPEQDLERVCRRFYRVDQSRHLPGNGLGLSIVAAIVQLHDAGLELRNAAPGLEARLVFAAA